ncbi:hypothetical protein BWD09_05430 [Neisseria dentiae]|uniref:Carboxymuconolactone decarboxylase-like domain-containing protein n=1 Tax=Neisseria dentiae TaxID=194197 RepID=A0A1X3DD61_9NEIS|nr:carboxymuconolactone decarboxylase family protein [Neisseria dentiae]OSI17437.1 hypothetical protein BWD09_05430 [Neisseria dentiae]STZ51810.1 4-carboxymuconolactone decarboxylase [Neisseria dentiae]
MQQRELITLAALGGCEKQLCVHIYTSLNVGWSKQQVIETFMQCIPYVGFPKALNTVYAAEEVLAASGEEDKP